MEMLLVLLILAVLVGLAVPAYANFISPAQAAAARSNVRAAVPAAEEWMNANGTYVGISGGALRSTAGGIDSSVKAVAVNSNLAYCIQDPVNGGPTFENYVGGNPGSALKAGYNAATLQYGTCQQAVGAAAH